MQDLIPIVVPTLAGVRALDDLHAVPWAKLSHAYGYPVPPHEVPVMLSQLAALDEDSHDDGYCAVVEALWHQGTVYQVTAYAVPFLCALAADPPLGAEEYLLTALVPIGAVCLSPDNAPHAPAIMSAFSASTPHIQQVALRPGQAGMRKYLVALSVGQIGKYESWLP